MSRIGTVYRETNFGYGTTANVGENGWRPKFF